MASRGKTTLIARNHPQPDFLCGDSTKLLKEMVEQKFHLVLTDPPYFLDGLDDSWQKGASQTPRGTGVIGSLPVGMKFDPKQGHQLQQFISQVGELLLPIMYPGAFAVMFSNPRLAPRMAVGLEDAGFEIRDIYAWRFRGRSQFKAFSMDHFIDRKDIPLDEKEEIKRQLGGRKTPQLRAQFESIILAQKPKDGTHIENWLKYKTGLIDPTAGLSRNSTTPSTIMSVEKPRREQYNGHLTVKPLRLIEHLIRLFSVKGQVILDPFLGSGTTALAARRTGRFCVGIEINQDYIDIAKRRLEESGK